MNRKWISKSKRLAKIRSNIVHQPLGIASDVNDLSTKILGPKGSLLGHIAQDMIGRDLDVNVYSSNAFHFAPEWAGLDSKVLAEKLQKWMRVYPDDRAVKKLQAFLGYLQAGGKISIVSAMTTALIDSLLDKGYLILGPVESSWLWGRRKVPNESVYDDIRGHAEGHYVVVYKKDAENYYISDPYPTGLEKDGLYTLNKDIYLTTLVNYDAEFIAVK